MAATQRDWAQSESTRPVDATFGGEHALRPTLDPRLLRFAFAVLASGVAVGVVATRGFGALDIVLCSVIVAGFWASAIASGRGRLLVYIAAAAVPVTLNLTEVHDEVSMFFLVLAVGMAGALESRLALAVAVLTGGLAVVVTLGVSPVADGYGWPNWVFGTIFSFAFGYLANRYRLIAQEYDSARAALADQAAAMERERIARDVHDLVGHSLSVMMLHITGARHVLATKPEEAAEALELAEETGRSSLAEIRRTVGLLRNGDSGSGNHHAGSPAPSSAPSPGLDDIAGLVERFDHPNRRATLSLSGPTHAIDAATEITAFRIVQEALTNAARHGGAGSVEVAIHIEGDECRLSVANERDAVNPARTGGTDGFGIVSMRERAASIGGTVTSAPQGSRWLVTASLPTSATSPARQAGPR